MTATTPDIGDTPKVYNLPEWPGWQEKSTAEGKKFYIDHTTRKTHWKHPSLLQAEASEPASPTEDSNPPGPRDDAAVESSEDARPEAPAAVLTYNLPEWPGWEQKSTAAGKTFFVDHPHKKTHWKHPSELGVVPRVAAASVDSSEACAEPAESLHEEVSEETPAEAAADTTEGEDLEKPAPEAPDEPPQEAMPEAAVEPDECEPSLAANTSASESPGSKVYNLPEWPGWEEKTNQQGKTFYVDHRSKETSWKHPATTEAAAAAVPEKPVSKSLFSSLLKAGVSSAKTLIQDKLDEKGTLVTSMLDTVGQHFEETEENATGLKKVAKAGMKELKGAVRDTIGHVSEALQQTEAFADMHELLYGAQPGVYTRTAPEPARPTVGSLRVEVLGSSDLTLESGRAAVSPFVEICVEHLREKSTAEKPEPGEEATEAIQGSYQFEVSDVGGDVLLTVFEETKWGRAGMANATLGVVCVPIYALLPALGTTSTQRGWFELLPAPNHNGGLKYNTVVPAEARTGLNRPVHPPGSVHLEFQLTLSAQPLQSYALSGPLELPPDNVRFDILLTMRHAARIKAALLAPPRWLSAVQLGASGSAAMGASVLLSAGYGCFLAPVWQYPLVLVAVVALLGALGTQVSDPALEIWNDQIDDPDANLSLAQKTRKAVVFLSKLQAVLGYLASGLEKARVLFSWRDRYITILALAASTLLAVLASTGLYALQSILGELEPWLFTVAGFLVFGVVSAGLCHELWLPQVQSVLAPGAGKAGLVTQVATNLYMRIPDANEVAHRRIAATQRRVAP